MRILLIDDENEFLQTLHQGLLAQSHVVETANNGQTGWEIFEQQQPFDLIIMDINMPSINGLDLLKKIREEDPIIPVVIMTRHGDLENSVQALRLSAFDFLLKPFKFQQLKTIIEKLESLQNPAEKLKDLLPFYEETLQFSIPSRLKCVETAIERIQFIFSSIFKIQRLNSTQIAMCLGEAINNATIHGNLEVPSALKEESWDTFHKMVETREKMPQFGTRRIRVTCHLTPQFFSVEVEDEGSGFDTSSLPDPRNPENLLAASGRGLFLIRIYMDQVTWNAKGNRIRMVKTFQ